jgi:hypothetical protein
LALPQYALALVLSFLSDVLGSVAAKIAGDDVCGQPLHDSRMAAAASGFGGVKVFWLPANPRHRTARQPPLREYALGEVFFQPGCLPRSN